MKRRAVLVGGIGTLLAGCLGGVGEEDAADSEADDSEGTDSRRVDGGLDEGDEELSEEEVLSQIEPTLEALGVEPVAVERGGDLLDLEYLAAGRTDAEVASEIAVVADVYAAAIDEGLTTTRLEATALDPDDMSVLDRFSIETAWVEAYLSGEIDRDGYYARVDETFESVGPSEDEVLEMIEPTLAEFGIGLLSIDRQEEALVVAYASTGVEDDALVADIGAVSDVYAAAIDEGLTTTRLEATAFDPDGEREIGSFSIETAWVEAYLSGEIDRDAYVGRVEERFERVELSDDQIVDRFESALESTGTEIRDLSLDEELLALRYTTVGTSEDGVPEELGAIADLYARAIDEGLSASRLRVRAFDTDDDENPTRFVVETAWVEDYLSGEVGREEYHGRVEGTLERANGDEGDDGDGDEE